jgi:Flp pilus assembly protein TadD
MTRPLNAVLEQVLQLDSSNAEAARRLAWSKVAQGDNHAAEQWMKIAAQGLPAGVEKDLASAWMHQMAGRMEDAVKAYRSVTEAEPQRAEAWEAMANLLYRRSDFSGAEAAFAKLVELKPDHAEAWTRVGSLNLKLGRRDAALKAWEEALRLDPKNAIVKKNLSVLKG